ncbi:DEAD/DEAH box helicase domain-containing protein [Kineococcus xinjiangensis]|uniref:DEAD/DEAH box helicase domain-containing protein n=1 Tax=Kineococcus xinjiangensis TaxID=512762 RepID=A0A2S6IFH2_9ACTN|nr:DEAD/DEAH box helicase [Kineococcus xinjiangensis]PPK92936.1 DEAD/DEAH box helicase domain-containing protein [Kineococcus xinjiangensis]
MTGPSPAPEPARAPGRAGAAAGQGDAERLEALLRRRGVGRLRHLERLPARAGRTGEWPAWADPEVVAAFTRRGVQRPWLHQVRTAEAVHAGRSTVLSAGTASGKSLAYLLPVLSDLRAGSRGPTGRDATALYLSPTKALAADQLDGLRALGVPGVRAATYDGDTPPEERRWVREHAGYVLTNADMLHRSLLPGHERWSSFLRRLRYVVVDECHSYRGVFGAHTAAVLRRLRRIAARYGARPVFVLASATVADPAATARRLVGLDVEAVVEDTSTRGPVSLALWEPPLLVDRASSRGGGPALETGDGADVAEALARLDDALGAPEDTAPAGPEDPAGLDDRESRRATARATGHPPAADGTGPLRRSATAEAADLLADLVSEQVRTLVFVRSRHAAEAVATTARRVLAEIRPSARERVAAYRGGFLPEERRALEADLREGRLLGLSTTSALELGVDVSGLDAVLVAGWPGTRASWWQQVGRAGRRGGHALGVLIARDDPLDTYLVNHPEALLGPAVEAAVFDPGNPYVLAPHLCAAAAEIPLSDADLELFGPTAADVCELLVQRGMLRRRPTGWYWTRRERAADLTDLRGGGGEPVRVVERGTGRVLGTVDASASHHAVFPGAVYVHQGVTHLVDDLDLEESVAVVHREEPDYTTHARELADVRVLATDGSERAGAFALHWGVVEVASQVVGFLRRRLRTGQVLGEVPLDLPERRLRTRAVWWTVDPEVALDLLAAADGGGEAARAAAQLRVPGALHAAEHAAIGMLPLLATCDRWDLGGLSTAAHPDTGLPTVFVHDAVPGGAGFSDRGRARAARWIGATRDAVGSCECAVGCPSCVQSPKCGNGNEPLDKEGALALLGALAAALAGVLPEAEQDPAAGTGPGG